MMVWGSVVSSEALAGAVSGSKAVPVTLTFKDGIAYIGMMPADLLSPLF